MNKQPESLSTVLAPARNQSLPDNVTDRLREAILQGGFKPGEPLREKRLAAMLDVSRGPVRLALIRLEREGLVLVRRHRGATVARLSDSDIEEVYSLRLALERLAVQRAARHASDEDFAAMEAVLKAFDVALSLSPSERQVADLDLRFHDLIYRAARHQRLYESWTTLRSQIYIFLLSRNVANADFRHITVTGHTEILEVLRARDERKAVQVIEEHLRAAYDRLVKAQLERNRESGDEDPGGNSVRLAAAGRPRRGHGLHAYMRRQV